MGAAVWDAVVAGAGPAGSVAALVLARGGARVLLVDPDDFPRDKACGDFVGPRGVRLLGELGVPVAGGRVLDPHIDLQAPSGRVLGLPWSPSTMRLPDRVLAIARTDLDASLRDAALA
ncbi:MAG: FAD-dependent monooxygenase, partial [Solirubrobacterales bacterium]|nr:FAD-dependent monooxygenase [Solirubrobacterales bacterium]